MRDYTIRHARLNSCYCTLLLYSGAYGYHEETFTVVHQPGSMFNIIAYCIAFLHQLLYTIKDYYNMPHNA